MRLVFIADKSEAYVSMQQDQTLDAWGVDVANTQVIEYIGESGSITLFGDQPVSILNLEKLDHVKKTVAFLEKIDDISSVVGSGLIMTTTVPQRSLKKLNEIVLQAGGTVVAPLHESKSKQTPAAKLLDTINLRPDVKRHVLDYVGEDYDSLIPIVKNLSDIPREHHRKLTIEHLMMRLPQTPGLVPIWEVWNELERGNMQEAIQAYRRFPKSASVGVVIQMKNTLSLAYRVAGLQALDPKITKKALQEITGVSSGFRIDKIRQIAKHNDTNRLSKALEILTSTETRLKGGWPQSLAAEIVEMAIIALYYTLRR